MGWRQKGAAEYHIFFLIRRLSSPLFFSFSALALPSSFHVPLISRSAAVTAPLLLGMRMPQSLNLHITQSTLNEKSAFYCATLDWVESTKTKARSLLQCVLVNSNSECQLLFACICLSHAVSLNIVAKFCILSSGSLFDVNTQFQMGWERVHSCLVCIVCQSLSCLCCSKFATKSNVPCVCVHIHLHYLCVITSTPKYESE